MLSKTLYHGLTLRGAYSYGDAQNTIDPGSTAFSSWQLEPDARRSEQSGPWALRSQRRVTGCSCRPSYYRSYFGLRGDDDLGVLRRHSRRLNGAASSVHGQLRASPAT